MKINRKNLPLAAALCLASVLFTVLVCLVDVQPVGPQGTEVGFAKLNSAFHNLTGESMTWYKITEIVGYLAILIVGVFCAIGVMQLIRRKSIQKVDQEIIAIGVLFVVIAILYVVFEKFPLNYRPVIMEGETEPEASFPSSHTLLACTVFGSTILMADRLKDRQIRQIVTVAMFVLIAVMIIGRLVSGVHWLTDILASILYSAALLTVFSMFLRKRRRRSAHVR